MFAYVESEEKAAFDRVGKDRPELILVEVVAADAPTDPVVCVNDDRLPALGGGSVLDLFGGAPDTILL